MRRFWLAVHRYLGLGALLFLAVAALTGCILSFRGPLDAALNPDLFRRASAAPLDAPAAVAAYEGKHRGVVALSFPLRVGPGEALPVSVAAASGRPPLGYDQVFLSDSGGHVSGVRATRAGWDRRHLMEGVYLFHYTLLGGRWGRWLMGLAALAWLIGAGVGLYLTFPSRGPFWRGWIPSWRLSLRGRLPKALLSLHEATGLWLLVPVVILAFTSVSMNFFDEAFTPAVQALSPARPSPFDPGAGRRPSSGQSVGFAPVIGSAEARARDRGLGWRPAAVWRRPDLGLYGVSFTNDGRVNFSRLGPITYVFDGASGRFVYEDNPYEDSAGRALSRALYPLHTGKMAGPAGVALDVLLGLVTIAQCVTGAYLWWKRRGPRVAARRARRRERAPA